jgi:toxin-antitoxin system PIN domain toxin
MSGLIDTNILLYAANADCDEHCAARDFLLAALRHNGTYYLTEGICYEFLRVATHTRVFPKPLGASSALEFLHILLTSETVHLLRTGERHWDVLAKVVGETSFPAGNLFFDICTVAMMREAGVRTLYTADQDFLQFGGIEVVNPVRRLT